MNQITFKSIFLLIAILAPISATIAQENQNHKLSIIMDKDGYTNVREKKSTDSVIVGKIKKNEFFYSVPNENSSWWRVNRKGVELENEKIKPISGFMHNSRICIFDEVDKGKKKKIVLKIMSFYHKKIQKLAQDPANKDSINSVDLFRELRYSYILPAIREMILEDKDPEITKSFVQIVSTNNPKHDPETSAILTDIYMKNKKFLKKFIKEASEEGKNKILALLQEGVLNSDQIDKNKKENIDHLRKEIENYIKTN